MKLKLKHEGGITLIALIITIVILVILAAVSIRAVYSMGIVGQATNGVQKYATKAVEENEMVDNTTAFIEKHLGILDDIENGRERELLAPAITLSGTEGNNGWYKGNVTVTITDSASADSTGAKKIKYVVTGANAISETIVEGTSTTFTITSDGTSEITAYTIDNSNELSDAAIKTAYKDTIAPTVSFGGIGGEGESLNVSASGNDSGSGIYSYKFLIGTSSNLSTVGTIISSENSASYTYENLTSNYYYVNAIVTDMAGNESSAEMKSVSRTCCFDPGSQILMSDGTAKNIEDVVVGDYVMSLNEDTGDFISQIVTNTIVNHNSDDLVYVNLSDGTKIGMRAYHPLLTTEGWKSLRPELAQTTMEVGESVDLLQVGDVLVGFNGNAVIVSIEEREYIENYDTYNLSVEGYHNYIVDGYVAHNRPIMCQWEAKHAGGAGI